MPRKSFFTAFVAMLLLFVGVAEASNDDDDDSAVVALTPENYDAVTAGKIVFIKLFAPWCGVRIRLFLSLYK